MSEQDQNQASHNPYTASTFSLDEPKYEVNGELIPNGVKVNAGDAISWLSEGFDFFKRNPGIWIALVIIYIVVNMVLGLVPFLGRLATTILAPVLTAGLMLGCLAQDQGRELEIEHLFAGFKRNTGKLVMVGVLSLVAYIAVFVALAIGIAILAGGAAMTGALSGGAQGVMSMMGAGMGIGIALLVLVTVLLLIPVAMATYYAPALVVFHDLEAIDALKMSFAASLKNLPALIVLGIVVMVLAVLSVVTLFLGLLVLLPTAFAAHYVSYKRVFLNR
ncbi:MAG: hypothetical protein JO218_06395 [Burkholderiales bacterium]|nr:hypothetical protein [Burkholderiales bacterium]